jgi:hypothetical protein
VSEEHLRVQERDVSIFKKDQEIQNVIKERDQYAVQIARMTINNPGIGAGSQAIPVARKSVKLDNPPKLSDGKEPRFEEWHLLIDQKLQANADHYDTPALRKALVISCTEGKARRHLAVRMRDESTNPYVDSKDMLDHLKTIYADPNRVITAKHKFRNLYMKGGDKFHDFVSEFLWLAAEAEIAEESWKTELYHKFTTELQKLTIAESIRAGGSFQEFTEYCSQTASHLEVINNRTQRNRNFANRKENASDNTTPNPRPSTPAVKREGTPAVDRIPDNERDRLMREGKCFNCKKPGHLSFNCPDKTAAQLKALEKDATGGNSNNESENEEA